MDGNDMEARDSAVFDESAFTEQSVQVFSPIAVHGTGSFRPLYQIAAIILCLPDMAFTGPLQLAYDFAGQIR
jgi:hypothetical protein